VNGCACPATTDDVACIGGNVYGPCSHPLCGGVCEYDRRCPCGLHLLEADHEAPPQYGAPDTAALRPPPA
jgi:hypothetical protein